MPAANVLAEHLTKPSKLLKMRPGESSSFPVGHMPRAAVAVTKQNYMGVCS